MRGRFSQWMMRRLLAVPVGQRPGMIEKLLSSCRKRMARTRDPLWNWTIDGMELELPISHNLPFYRKKYPLYDTALARLAKKLDQSSPLGSCIDVGANVGDTAVLLRGAGSFPILAIEADAGFFAILERNARRVK